jgi:hypothetical protein
MHEACGLNVLVKDKKCIKKLIAKSEGKKHLDRSIRTTEDNITTNLQIWWVIVDFFHLVQDKKK